MQSKISKHEKPKFSEIFKKIPKQMPEELARNVSGIYNFFMNI
jgi:hypothetical protein